MSDELFGDRRKALEDSFFAKENERALEKLRAAKKAKQDRETLAAASGIADEAVLDELVGLGFTPASLAALSLYPLVAVAWADRKIAPAERRAILHAAEEAGIGKSDVSHEILAGWMESRPGPELMRAWCDMVAALKQSLATPAFETLRHELIGYARGVAEAAGGVMGIGKRVSDAEQAVLDQLTAAFE